MKIYFAPLEGITDHIYRNTFEKYFGGIDKYYTPFITPTSVKKFQTKELNNIDPEINDVEKVVPQILTNNAEHFLWAAEEIKERGFKEVNLNLGCPSGTVVAKRKGSGLLTNLYELDDFLGEIFLGCDHLGMKLSVKTRLGRDNPDEFYEIMDIFNKYPIYELTIHPRIRKDFYREPVRPEYFDYAYKKSKNPLCYNGDIRSTADIGACFDNYPNINAVMIGRGLLMDPAMASQAKAGILSQDKCTDTALLKEFHDDIMAQFKEKLSGSMPVLHHMKDIFTFMSEGFKSDERIKRNVLKSKKLEEYEIRINQLFDSEM